MSVPTHAALVVALLAAIACPASAVPYRTVVVFGDTQALVVEREADPSESYLRFLEMTRWVAEHRESENIDFVLHVGDITQHGSVCAFACDEADAQRVNAEWDRFLEGWASIERAHIPYAIVPGNHDNVYPLLTPTPERSTPVDAFASFFGRDEFEGSGTHVATCDADTPDDRCHGFTTLGHVWTFELGSQDVLVAGLPNQPTGGAMAWFEDEMKAQPDTPAILLSHQWLRPFDFLWFRYVATGRAGTLGPLTEQVFMTAMGHFTADVQEIVPQGDYRILSVQYDRQAVSGNGDAAILLVRFYFDPAGLDGVDALRVEPGPSIVRNLFPGRTPFSIDNDLDNDEVPDPFDNCPLAWNPGQQDSDADGDGNRCDADFDDDGEVGRLDLRMLRHCLRLGRHEPRRHHRRPGAAQEALPPSCAAMDMDGSGRVSRRDLRLFLEQCGEACEPGKRKHRRRRRRG